jgi:hypothetical protein
MIGWPFRARYGRPVTTENIDWGGQRGGEPTEVELTFATELNAMVPGLDFWLHADDDGAPWLLVSKDRRRERS